MPDNSGDRLRDGTGAISRAESFLERARNLMVSIAVVVGFVVIAVSLIINGWSGRYSIEPISAPDDFQKKVENSVGIAALLRDDLNKLVQQSMQLSGTKVAIKPIDDQKAPEVTVMGTTISIDYFIGALRKLIGKEYPKITGEISYINKDSTPANPPMLCPNLAKSAEPVRLILRVGEDGGVPFFEGEGAFPEVALCGALYTLRIIDPYSAASYLGQRPQTQMQAFKLLEEVAAESPSRDTAEIDLIRGNIELGNGKKPDAERLFNQASSDYNDRHRGRIGLFGWYPAFDGLTTNIFEEDGWYPAFDGLATTYLLEGKYDQALASVEKALELRHDYQSAMFHKAQIFDFQFRDERNNENSNKCRVLNHVNKAKTSYDDVVSKHPDMGVAYLNKGLMLLLLDTYWHFNPTVGCVPGQAEYTPGVEALAKHVQDLDREAEANFREAIMLDPEDPNAWLQLGILLMQRQEPGWHKPEPLTKDSRRDTLNEAIASLNHANKLKPDDTFIRSRLDQAKSEKEASEARQYFNTSEKLQLDYGGVRSWLNHAALEQEALQ